MKASTKAVIAKALPKELQQIVNIKMKVAAAPIKAKIALCIIPFILIYIGIFFLIALFGGADFNTTNQLIQKQEGFRVAFSESIKASTKLKDVYFTEILAAYILNIKNPETFDKAIFDGIINNLMAGARVESLVKNKSDYKTLYNIYDASYRGIIDTYQESNQKKYFVNWFFPAPKEISTQPTPEASPSPGASQTPGIQTPTPGATPQPSISQGNKVQYSYSDDFLNAREYAGDAHFGNDIMMDEGVPIVAIESGKIEEIGWNNAGGWRVGIRSQDGKRYWYYAHMRKLNPYRQGLVKGLTIQAGELLGYTGSTGYSPAVPANAMPPHPNAVDGKFANHLHLGLKVKLPFATGPTAENGEQWVNPYPVIKFLETMASQVTATQGTPDYSTTIPSKESRLIK